ncbi:MAG: DMT family transporter [Leptothrix sp. (in: b-proteobacteria)]
MKLTPKLTLLLTVPPMLWAGNAVVGRVMVPLVPPLRLNALRWLLTLLVLLVIGRQAIATPARRQAIWQRRGHFARIGLLGVGAYNAMQYLALTTSTPINVTLIAASMPLWMVLIGALFFGERPHARQMAGAALSLAGVAVVLGRGDPAALARVQFVQGDLFMLVAAACWAGYSWLLVRPPSHMLGAARPMIDSAARADQPATQRPWNWSEFLLVQVLFGVLWASGAAGLEAVLSPQQAHWSASVGWALAYLVAGPSLLAYACYGRAVAVIGPTTASLFVNLTPLFAALLSTALLGEAPHAYHGVAFGLIVAGIAASARRG